MPPILSSAHVLPPAPPPQVSTLFPSAKSEEGIKGGVVLLRMRPPPGTDARTAPPLRLSARYADRWAAAGLQSGFSRPQIQQIPASPHA